MADLHLTLADLIEHLTAGCSALGHLQSEGCALVMALVVAQGVAHG